MTYYQIRRRTDGLYSTGGTNPRFTKRGKLWTKSPLHSHLNLVAKYGSRGYTMHPYADCDVIEIELTEKAATDIDTYRSQNSLTV